jgi:hypothetical protein
MPLRTVWEPAGRRWPRTQNLRTPDENDTAGTAPSCEGAGSVLGCAFVQAIAGNERDHGCPPGLGVAVICEHVWPRRSGWIAGDGWQAMPGPDGVDDATYY